MKSTVATRRAAPGAAPAAPASAGRAPGTGDAGVAEFLRMYRAEPIEHVRLVKTGVPADLVDSLARKLGMPKERLANTLGLARATIDRKMRENKALSSADSSRVVGLARLIGQVQALIEESGEPEGFDAPAWLAAWLEQPLAALDGRRPAELMDTAEGQALVSNLVARIQSGAYA